MVIPERLENHVLGKKIGFPVAFADLLSGRRPNRTNLAWRKPPLKMVFLHDLFAGGRPRVALGGSGSAGGLFQGALRIRDYSY